MTTGNTAKRKRIPTKLARREPKGKKGKKSKKLIQKAIIDLVSVDGLGLRDIKLDAICRKAGLTIGAFYFHFENKDAAIEETAADHLNEFAEQLLTEPAREDLREELERIIEAYVVALAQNRKMMLLIYTTLRRSPAVHEVYVQQHFKVADRLEGLVKAARKGRGGRGKNTQLIVEFLMAGIESLGENIYLWNDERMSKLGKDPKALSRKLADIWLAVARTEFS